MLPDFSFERFQLLILTLPDALSIVMVHTSLHTKIRVCALVATMEKDWNVNFRFAGSWGIVVGSGGWEQDVAF